MRQVKAEHGGVVSELLLRRPKDQKMRRNTVVWVSDLRTNFFVLSLAGYVSPVCVCRQMEDGSHSTGKKAKCDGTKRRDSGRISLLLDVELWSRPT